MNTETRPGGPVERIVRRLSDHIEQRIRTWRQQQMNRSGDRLAIDDFMGEDSIADLVDYVCDEHAIDAVLHGASKPPNYN